MLGGLSFIGSASSDLNNTVTSVTESGGTFTCNFALGYICLVNQGSAANPITPTLQNLPSNQFVHFVFNNTNLKLTAWPSNVKCSLADVLSNCGTVNGYSVTNFKYSTTFWSDGTNLWSTPDTGNIQTVTAAHLNTGRLDIYDVTTGGGGAGQVNIRTGSFIRTTGNQCSSSASPAVCSNYMTGYVALPASATSLVVNTTSLSTLSMVFLVPDSSIGSKFSPSITCNTGTPSWRVSDRTVNTSFTISVDVAPVTDPYCFSYMIMGNSF